MNRERSVGGVSAPRARASKSAFSQTQERRTTKGARHGEEQTPTSCDSESRRNGFATSELCRRRSDGALFKIVDTGRQGARVQDHRQVFGSLRVHVAVDFDLISDRLIDARKFPNLAIKNHTQVVLHVRRSEVVEGKRDGRLSVMMCDKNIAPIFSVQAFVGNCEPRQIEINSDCRERSIQHACSCRHIRYNG